MIQSYDALVIGAGISGLIISSRLHKNGFKTKLVEKSKSVGGRIATRRIDQATFDHGAQFYKIEKEKHQVLDSYLSKCSKSHIWFQDQKYLYKVAEKGLTQIAKDLAQNLDVAFNEKVMSIHSNSREGLNGWDQFRIECESGQQFVSQRIYLTSPLPQSLEILKNSNLSYPQELEKIEYAKALVGLFQIQSQSNLINKFQYQQDINHEIFSLSNQYSKKVSKILAFTVVMTPQWSHINFEKSEEEIIGSIKNIFSSFLRTIDSDFTILDQQIKKWRYSHPLQNYQAPYLDLSTKKSFILLGDAFGGPSSIEGAAQSAESVPLI
jgi:renalase